MLASHRTASQTIAGKIRRALNLMDQYHPAGKVGATQYPEINRRTLSSEFFEARQFAWSLGLHRLMMGANFTFRIVHKPLKRKGQRNKGAEGQREGTSPFAPWTL
jgi:hypothetical protein